MRAFHTRRCGKDVAITCQHELLKLAKGEAVHLQSPSGASRPAFEDFDADGGVENSEEATMPCPVTPAATSPTHEIEADTH